MTNTGKIAEVAANPDDNEHMITIDKRTAEKKNIAEEDITITIDYDLELREVIDRLEKQDIFAEELKYNNDNNIITGNNYDKK